MLFGHFLHTHVCTDNHNAEIWRKASQAVDGCLEIFFVATEISDGDDFAADRYDLAPILVFVLVESLGEDLLALFVKTHNFVSNGTGPAGFLFMEIVKDSDTGRSITIVFDTFGQDGDKGWFTGIDVTNDTEL